MKSLAPQSRLTVCDPMDCSPPGFSVRGTLQARMPEWVAISSPSNLSHPGVEPSAPALQMDFSRPEPPGKARNH